MFKNSITVLTIGVFVLFSGCKYAKGDIYKTTLADDSLNFVILDKGKGYKLSEKAATLKFKSESKGNIYRVHYVTDSVEFAHKKGILLFSATLPDFNNDILTKGYFGGLTSKQETICMLVSYEDLEKYFKRKE
jgi:hypothetical protein